MIKASEAALIACSRAWLLVEQHYLVLAEHMARQGRPLPDYVQREFEYYLKCNRLEHGFLRVQKCLLLLAAIARLTGNGKFRPVCGVWHPTDRLYRLQSRKDANHASHFYGREYRGDRSAVSNQCHRPEQTLLHHIIEESYPAFTAHLVAQGEELPCYVQLEFEG